MCGTQICPPSAKTVDNQQLYSELLLSPSWKIKSAEIRRRDGNRCTACGSKDDLQVHHTFYFDSFPAPWKYPSKSLLTLCGKCHHDFHLHHEVPIKHLSGRARKEMRADLYVSGMPICRKKKWISLAEQQDKRGLRVKRRAS